MDLAQLIVTLRPLLSDAQSNWPEIERLLEANVDLAEYEVARHYVNHRLAQDTADGGDPTKAMLRDLDPLIRLRGVKRVVALYPRSAAARALRGMASDSDVRVRSHALHSAWLLGIDDVALPNTRVPEQQGNHLWRRGGWNPSGWLFGIGTFSPTRASSVSAHGVPPLPDRESVAAFVGIAEDDLNRLLRPGVGNGAPYVEFEIAKATGGTRRIAAPRAPLRAAQRIILHQLINKLPVHDACHGFVTGRSIVTNAEPHLGATLVIKMDLRDFFPTIHYRRVAGFFRSLGYDTDVAQLLAGLVTHRPVLPDGRIAWPGRLPQGAPTSPALANQIAGRLDARLSGFANKTGARYTRYADDLTFSFEASPDISVGRFCWWVDQICGQEGFTENAAKRRILRPGNQQRVTGIVVNSKLSVPREAKRRFRAILHNCQKNGVAAEARGHRDFPAYLRGFASFVNMVEPTLGARWRREVETVLAQQGTNPKP